jgi:hypothetical protein
MYMTLTRDPSDLLVLGVLAEVLLHHHELQAAIWVVASRPEKCTRHAALILARFVQSATHKVARTA